MSSCSMISLNHQYLCHGYVLTSDLFSYISRFYSELILCFWYYCSSSLILLKVPSWALLPYESDDELLGVSSEAETGSIKISLYLS